MSKPPFFTCFDGRIVPRYVAEAIDEQLRDIVEAGLEPGRTLEALFRDIYIKGMTDGFTIAEETKECPFSSSKRISCERAGRTCRGYRTSNKRSFT